MLATLHPKKFKDKDYTQSPKAYQERYAYEQAVRSEMMKRGVKELPRADRVKIAETILNAASTSTSGWNPFNYGDGLNLDATRGEVMTQDFISRSTGRTDLEAPLKDWAPVNPVTGERVDDAQKVKKRIIDLIRAKKGSEPTTAEAAALWVRCFDPNGNRIPIKGLDE